MTLLDTHELKQRHEKEYFESLKVAHDKFTWNGMKYHVRVGMVDTAGKIFGSRVWMHKQYSRSVQIFGLAKGC